jgi:uncharacterized membrane protein YesL
MPENSPNISFDITVVQKFVDFFKSVFAMLDLLGLVALALSES